MNLKNINNLFLLIILLLFFISCSKENSIIEIVETDIIETLDYIEETNFIQKNKYFDFYNRNDNFNWRESEKLKKIYDISFGHKSDIFSTSPSNIIISDNHAYYVDSENKFVKLDLNELKKVFDIQLEENLDSNLVLPTSIIKKDDFFYVGYGNGIIIKIDNDGKRHWKKDYKDLLRTPIRIVKDSIVLLFNSNHIILLDTSNGNEIWEFNYNLNKPSLSSGGQILVKHNLIFFIMPNGRIGSIDFIIGESVDHSFVKDIIQKNVLNYHYEAQIHTYKNLLSLIEDNYIIYTYDLDNEKFLLFHKQLNLAKSVYFINNSLLALGNNNILTSYNIKNNNIFWKVDLSKFLSKKDIIIESYVIKSNILIFFDTGKIVQLNKLNGDILFKQDLNLKDINLVTASENYFIFNQSNGKAFFYKQ